MTIYIDVTTAVRWKGHPTGIARVVENLALSLAIKNSNVQLVGLKDNEILEYSDELLETHKLAFLKERDIFLSIGANWDIENYNQLLKGLKSNGVIISVLFYDVIPILYPYFYGPGFSEIYRLWLIETLELADHGFAISASTKADLANICKETGVDIFPIDVIRIGDKLPLQVNNEILPVSNVVEIDRFILAVGTIEYRKNHSVLLNAYRLIMAEQLCDKAVLPTLVIIGRPGWLDNNILFQIDNDPLLKEAVVVVSDINDAELDKLYQSCMFTVFPAIYEGWGLPVAESLSYGKQCITSYSSSMKEIAPELTRFAHPLKVEEWAEAIVDLTVNSGKLNSENAAIRENYKITSWDQTASLTYEALRKLM